MVFSSVVVDAGEQSFFCTRVLLNTIEKVKRFVNIVSQYDADMELGEGRYLVDAKSIMGVFSLDLSKPIVLTVHKEESKSQDLLQDIAEFRVQQ